VISSFPSYPGSTPLFDGCVLKGLHERHTSKTVEGLTFVMKCSGHVVHNITLSTLSGQRDFVDTWTFSAHLPVIL